MNKRIFPQIHFYDKDFIDIYERAWKHIEHYWQPVEEGMDQKYFYYPEEGGKFLDQYASIFSTFFLVYSNRNYIAETNLDYFYRKQEITGAIRSRYNLETDTAVITKDNPEGIGIPIFAWAELNVYNMTANKRRLKEVLPILENYMQWLNDTCRSKDGLYHAPAAAMNYINGPRKECFFPADFNACVALNTLCLAEIADILNEKEIEFKYKKMYFGIKTRINEKMWDEETGFYYDLDKNESMLLTKALSSYWTLLAEVPNKPKVEKLLAQLADPKVFGTEHPFPSLAVSDVSFNEKGNGYCGSVFPELNYMVIKGMQKYGFFESAREYAMRHIYFVLETIFPSDEAKAESGTAAFWEAYNPYHEGPASWQRHSWFPRKDYVLTVGLTTISMMIENVLGLEVNLPRKTIDWTISNIEEMGIQNISLKKNMIRKITTEKTNRGWEIKIENEKLYYFALKILDQNKDKRLPIPSGTCSMLIEKL